MSSSSSHTFDQVRINGALRNSAGDEVDLTDLLHEGDIDLSGYALSTAVDTAIEGYLEDYTPTTSLGGVIDTALASYLTAQSYPSGSSITALTNRFYKATSSTSSTTPTNILSIEVPSNRPVSYFEVLALAKTQGTNIDDDECFSSKMNILVQRLADNSYQMQIANGEALVSKIGAASWSFAPSQDGNMLRLQATGPSDKDVKWSVVAIHDTMATV